MIRVDYTPREWQRLCHQQRRRFTVLALHRRAGKTVFAVMTLLNDALKQTRPGSVYIYLAPFLKQAKAIAWGLLKQKVEPLRAVGGCEVSEGELSVRFAHNGAVIRIFGADNPDALRGMGLAGVVVDEVAQIKPEVWRDILQPALSDWLGWALFIGTPHGINLFSELYFAAEGKPEWFRARWTVYETNALDAKEVERIRDPSQMSETSFAREYLCDFAAAGDDQLISLTDVEAAAHRVYMERDIVEAPKIIGVDPARFGDDRSVIVKRRGLQVFDPLTFRGIDNMDLAARVAQVIQDWQPDAVFVDSGAGAGVIDRLRQLGFVVVEVPFGGKAMQPLMFKDRRAEMWFAMRDWLTAGGAIPNNADLKRELATPVFWFDPNGRKVLEAKDDIKKRLQGGASPDIADAVALTFAAPVQPMPRDPALRSVVDVRQRAATYDPIAHGMPRRDPFGGRR